MTHPSDDDARDWPPWVRIRKLAVVAAEKEEE
jgi:hypothetical protein